jgi:hypothetical protein
MLAVDGDVCDGQSRGEASNAAASNRHCVEWAGVAWGVAGLVAAAALYSGFARAARSDPRRQWLRRVPGVVTALVAIVVGVTNGAWSTQLLGVALLLASTASVALTWRAGRR